MATKSKKARAAEKRSSVRGNIITSALIPKGRSPDKIWVTNISLGGVGFQSERRYARGSKCSIHVEVGPIRFENACRIVWCRKRGRTAYDVGCELLSNEVTS